MGAFAKYTDADLRAARSFTHDLEDEDVHVPDPKARTRQKLKRQPAKQPATTRTETETTPVRVTAGPVPGTYEHFRVHGFYGIALRRWLGE